MDLSPFCVQAANYSSLALGWADCLGLPVPFSSTMETSGAVLSWFNCFLRPTGSIHKVCDHGALHRKGDSHQVRQNSDSGPGCGEDSTLDAYSILLGPS